MSNILCIYHGNCADGFGAAWAVHHALGSGVEFVAGVYQTPPPNVAGKFVVLVDFSYKREVIEQLAKDARSILILDHHKSAIADLSPIAARCSDGVTLRRPRGWEEHLTNVMHDESEGVRETCYAVFDEERSGAGIAWDFFHPGKSRPRLIDHIEDRDLWRFRLAYTREIQAALFSFPYDFALWDELMRTETKYLRRDGVAIERKHHKDVAELVEVTRRRMVIGGHNVPVANLPYTLTSDAGHLMAAGEPFAACYWDTPTGRVFSLRSRPEGLDVSVIAKQYGGGGHREASGFRVPFDALAQFEVRP